MITLSYKFVQNSSCLELAGMPDVSNGDSEQTIGIISFCKSKCIMLPKIIFVFPFLPFSSEPKVKISSIKLMESLKATYDPDFVLSPGRFVTFQ